MGGGSVKISEYTKEGPGTPFLAFFGPPGGPRGYPGPDPPRPPSWRGFWGEIRPTVVSPGLPKMAGGGSSDKTEMVSIRPLRSLAGNPIVHHGEYLVHKEPSGRNDLPA